MFSIVLLQHSELRLEHNHLRILSNTTFQSTTLIDGFVNLEDNKLIALPNSFFNKLGEFSLAYILMGTNHLRVLPDHLFASSTDLSSGIRFKSNNLTHLPEKIFTKLKVFYGFMDFSHNYLTFLPEGMFSSLISFYGYFNLEYNSFTR